MRSWTRSSAERATRGFGVFAGALAFALALAPPLVAGAAEGVAAGPDAAHRALTLETLMGRLAETSGVKTRFVEEKHLALLVAPLLTEGVLYFAAPDKLARMTERPAPATLVINGDLLVQRDATGVDRMDLGQSDVARQFVENFIVLFNGDLEAMRQRYEVAFSATDAGWQIRLEPRSHIVGRMIESILLAGEGVLLRHMEILETGGDRSVTRFDETVPDYAFSPEELLRLFDVATGPVAP